MNMPWENGKEGEAGEGGDGTGGEAAASAAEIQLQICVDAFTFSLLLLAKRFLCLCVQFEELRAQTLNDLEGVIEHISQMAKRPQYNSSSAAAEKNKAFFLQVPVSKFTVKLC